jgi:acyl-ACP thioesterase
MSNNGKHISAGPHEATGVREDTFTVKTYECGADGNVKITALMQHLQEAAAAHAEQLGFGNNWLNSLNSYWVLSNLRLEIAGLVRWNDQVTIRTWPSGCDRLTATREFVGRDGSGRELFRAGSEWMVLDKRSGRPKNLLRLDMKLPQAGPKDTVGKLERLKPQENYSEVEKIRVPYSSIDVNGHVNNTEYVRWGIDALRRAFDFKGSIRSLQISYLSEVFEGDELDLSARSGTGGEMYLLGSKSADQSNVYVMGVCC